MTNIGDWYNRNKFLFKLAIVDFPLTYLFFVVIVKILVCVHHFTIYIAYNCFVVPSFDLMRDYWLSVIAICGIWLLLKILYFFRLRSQIGPGNAWRSTSATVPELWQFVHGFILTVVELISSERIGQVFARIRVVLSRKEKR